MSARATEPASSESDEALPEPRYVPLRTAVRALLRKELALELRAPQAVPAMALFSVTTLVVFHFALQRGVVDGDLASGVLWVTLLFAAMLGISRLFVADHEEGGLDGFLLAPTDRTALLVAKAVGLFAFLVALEVVAVPAFALLLLGPSPSPAAYGQLAVLLVLADERDRRADPHARPDRAADGAAPPDPGRDRGGEGDVAARSARRFAGARGALALRPRAL